MDLDEDFNTQAQAVAKEAGVPVDKVLRVLFHMEKLRQNDPQKYEEIMEFCKACEASGLPVEDFMKKHMS
jgi:hypothetical protein